MKRFFTALLLLSLFLSSTLFQLPLAGSLLVSAKKNPEVSQPSLSVSAPSVLLMEAETGTILYQKKEHTARPPASVTKVMTLDLIFDALDKKQISLTDNVTVSENASSMGGSQVYLETGEVQTVETLIKCISVASANDACAAYMYRRHCNSSTGYLNWTFVFVRILKFIKYGDRAVTVHFYPVN